MQPSLRIAIPTFVMIIAVAGIATIAQAGGGSKASTSSTAHGSNSSQQRQQQIQQQVKQKQQEIKNAGDKSYFGKTGNFLTGNDAGAGNTPPAVTRKRCNNC